MSSCTPESVSEKFEVIKGFAFAAYTKCVPNCMQKAHSYVAGLSRDDLTNLAAKVAIAAVVACIIGAIAGFGVGGVIALAAVVSIGAFYYCARPEVKPDTEKMVSEVKQESVKKDGQQTLDHYFKKVSPEKEKLEKNDGQQNLEKYFPKLEKK